MSDGFESGCALFEVDGDVAVPNELTRGPWDPAAMHGGPPAALLARAIEQCEFLVPGPGSAWLRLNVPIVAGEDPTPAQRVAAAADFASGVGNPLDVTEAAAINADLTVAMHRHLKGDWVGLETRAWADPQGTGMAEAVIHDVDGPMGCSVQCLLVR